MTRSNKERANVGIIHHCSYVVAWCPKYGRNVLQDGVSRRLRRIIIDIVAAANSQVIELRIEPASVYLAAQVDPRLGIHKLVKRIKRESAGILRQEFDSLRTRLPTLWTNNYCVYTVGEATQDEVDAFLQAQKQR